MSDFDKIRSIVLANMRESDWGDFAIGNRFYSPNYGEETIEKILSEIKAALESDPPSCAMEVVAQWETTKNTTSEHKASIDLARRISQYAAERTEPIIIQRNALLSVMKELRDSAEYWSEYDVPVGIMERMNQAIRIAEEEI